MLKAYLFPETENSVKLKMENSVLPPSFTWSCKKGENGIILSAEYEDEDAAKKLLKDIFGYTLYSFECESSAEALVKRLSDLGRRMSIAESCTGGLFAKKITDISGASKVFGLGLTVYSNEAKEELLGVSKRILDDCSAVSREVADSLAVNVRKKAGSAVGVGITGYAGPDGGEDGTPVGTVYIGVSTEKECFVEKLQLGDKKTRDEIREEAVRYAISMVNRALDNLEDFPESKFSENKQAEDETVKTEYPAERVAVKVKRYSGGNIFDRVNDFFIAAYRYLIPQSFDEKKEKIRKIAFLVAIVIFIGSASYIGNYYFKRLNNDMAIEKLQDDYYAAPTKEEIDNLPEGYLQKFARLYSINSDIAGWIKAGATIDFPVVKTDDNDFYLKRDFYKKDNFHGVPYLDYRCSNKLLTTNTVIYGHNVKPNRMFAELTNYKRLAYYREYPTFTYDTVYEEHTFKVLYVMILDSDSSHGGYFGYQNFISATSETDFNNFINNCQKRTIINTTVDVNPTDTLLTLSTCGFDFSGERIVIVARMVRDGENTSVDTVHACANADVVMPDIWYSIWGGNKPLTEDSSTPQSSGTPDTPSSSTPTPPSSSTPTPLPSSTPTPPPSSTPTPPPSSTPEQEPASSEPEPVISEPEPVISEPEPTSSEPEPTSSEPEPTSSETEPASSEPEPVTSEPEPEPIF